MKNTFISLFIILSGLSAFAENDCSLEAESYVGVGYTQPGEFVGYNQRGQQVYTVRTNDQGGDAAYEVIVDAHSCNYISHRLLWTE